MDKSAVNEETEMYSTSTFKKTTLSSVFKRVCFIRSVKVIHIDINFIWSIQIIIRKYRTFTLIQRKVDIWSRELYPSGMGTIKIERIGRF